MGNTSEEINIKELIIKTLFFLKNHKKIWIITLIIALSAGIYKYFTTKIYFESSLYLTTAIVYEKSSDIFEPDLQPIMSMLTILQKQVENKNSEFLINKLNLQKPDFLKDLQVTVFIDKSLTKMNPNNIRVKVEVYDKSKLKELQDQILNYCNTNEYINNLFQNQQKFIKSSSDIIEQRVNEFDEINQIIKSFSKENKQILFINYNDWASIVDLELKKYKFQNTISSETPVIIVNEFNLYPKATNKKLINSVLYFVLVSFLGIVTAVFLELIKFLKNEK